MMCTEHLIHAPCSLHWVKSSRYLPYLPQVEIYLWFIHDLKVTKQFSISGFSLTCKTQSESLAPATAHSLIIYSHRRNCSFPKPQNALVRAFALKYSHLEPLLLTPCYFSLGIEGHLTIFLIWLLLLASTVLCRAVYCLS